MSIVGSEQWMYASGGGGYQINDSLRFEDGSSTYLYRTPAVTGNRKTWTFSCWFKRGNLGLSYPTIFSTNDIDAGQYTSIIFSNETLYLNASGVGANYTLITNQVFRDVSGWYHLVWSVDTTQATSTDRMKLYINGEQVTSFSTATYPSLNKDLDVNAVTQHSLGHFVDYGRHWDGYLSDTYLIDGQALDPTDFGETIDGYWRPVAYSGSYGTNGFHLDFNGNTNDASGNGNNFIAVNISAHDYVPDSPTNNFATYNRLVNTGQTGTYAEGNLAVTASSFWSSNVWRQGSIGVTGGTGGGKYYFEFVSTLGGNGLATGVAVQSSSAIDTTSHNDGVIYYYLSVKTGSTVTVSGITNNPAYDVLRFAFDASNGKVWIGNSTGWFNSGDPAAGTGESGTIANYDGSILVPVTNRSSTAGTHTFNFGQDSTFAGLKTSGSANGSDGNGIGDFYYAVPSGFLTLCTANLPTPTIVDGAEHFNTVLYTGDGAASKSITSVNFEPNFTWIKVRNNPNNHRLFDSVRGASSDLISNSTGAESITTTRLLSFDTDGFTVGSNAEVNGSGYNHVAWNWKAGGAAVSNTDGSITSQVSANVDAGFSIVSWTGNATTGATAGHGLSTKPSMVITKGRTYSNLWQVNLSSDVTGTAGYLNLDGTAAISTIYPNYYTSMDSSVLTFNGTTFDERYYNNRSGEDYIAYCFANSDTTKVGSYTGNGSSDGPFVYTGFRPAWILIKSTSASTDWMIYDNKRLGYNVDNNPQRNVAAVEQTDNDIDLLSNGFKFRRSSPNFNGATHIYLAFAENPFKYSNAR